MRVLHKIYAAIFYVLGFLMSFSMLLNIITGLGRLTVLNQLGAVAAVILGAISSLASYCLGWMISRCQRRTYWKKFGQ